MKRLALIFILLAPSLAPAATWYATSSSVNINAVGLWVPTQGTTCAGSGTALVWGAQATGDVFNANGCTALAVNVDPGGSSVQVTLTTDTAFGGGFTLTMANLGTIGTVHAHILATKTAVVALSGTTSSGTVSGNLTGGSTANAYGIVFTASSGTLTVSGNTTGGSASSAHGLHGGSSGSIIVNGNATAGSNGLAYGLNNNGTTTVTINGNCIGNDTVASYGCAATGTGVITLNGSQINGKIGNAINGRVFFTPAATNYILSPKDSSYVLGVIDTHATETPSNPGITNVKSGVAYGSFTGTMTCPSCASVQGWR
jgi:hypothetical protein